MKRKPSRKPGRHGQLADLAKQLIEIDADGRNARARLRELQNLAGEILSRKWGNPRSLKEAQEKGQAKSAGAAETYARMVMPYIERARADGVKTLDQLCDHLNARHVYTRWGHAWSKGTLFPYLKRIGKLTEFDNE